MENTYIVQKGDNLYDIAQKFNTTVGILKALNNLTSNVLQINQILKIAGKYNDRTFIFEANIKNTC